MTKIQTLAGIAGAALLGLGIAGTTLAQPAEAPPSARGGPPGAGPGHMRMDPAQMAAHRQAMQQRRAERLRAVLQLRPDQEPALQAFLTAMAPPEGMGGHRMGGHGGPGGADGQPEHLTTPQRLDRQAAMMAQHQQAFQRRAEAVRRFYAALSAPQQQAFDALHAGRGGPGMHHRRGGRGMGPGGPGGPGGMGPGFAPGEGPGFGPNEG